MPFTAFAIDRMQDTPDAASNQRAISPTVIPVQSPTLHIYSLPVYMQKPGTEVYVEVASGQSVPEGSFIRTGESGRAEVRFGDGTVTRIDINSSIHIEKSTNSPQQTVIELLEGRIWSRVKKLMGNESYSTSVDGVVATVRGTAFETRAIDTGGYTFVDEGIVEVACSPEKTVKLTANEAATALCDTTTPIVTVPVNTETLQDEWIQFNKNLDKNDPRPTEKSLQTTPPLGADTYNNSVTDNAKKTPFKNSAANPTISQNRPSPTAALEVLGDDTNEEKEAVLDSIDAATETSNTAVEVILTTIPSAPPIEDIKRNIGKNNEEKSNKGKANGREGGNGGCNGKGNPNCLGK